MDLNQVAREVIALTSNDLQRNGVIVQSEFAEDPLPVKGDRVQLQQVILNLVRNASDAMDEVHDRPRHLLIRTERESNGDVRLSVRDVGIGLEGQNVEKLFDPFYTTKSDGMGIGLAVSRSIIDRHQGRLWAEANDGPGATFAFTIPSGSGKRFRSGLPDLKGGATLRLFGWLPRWDCHGASVRRLRPLAVAGHIGQLPAQFHCFSLGPEVAFMSTGYGGTRRCRSRRNEIKKQKTMIVTGLVRQLAISVRRCAGDVQRYRRADMPEW